MCKTTVSRLAASFLSVVSYVLLTSGHPVSGVSLNLVSNLLLLPFAWQSSAYDMVTLCGVFSIINLQTLISHTR